MQLFSRSNNRILFSMMKSLVPPDIKCISVEGFDNWLQSADYLYYVIGAGNGMVINCDIDCFVYDWEKVYELIEEMKQGGYTHLGAHDGGDIQGRSRSWATMNPFFNIFNTNEIRNLKGIRKWTEVARAEFKPEWEKDRPDYLRLNYNHVNDEPFHGFFYWLYDVGKPYFIKTTLHSDDISTDTGFALHSWYSRLFDTPTQHKRIVDLYEQAKHRSTIPRPGGTPVALH